MDPVSDTLHNPELHRAGGAYRILKHRGLGALIALMVLALIVGLLVWVG